MEDAGQSGGAVKNGVRLPAAFEGFVRKGLAGFQEMVGPAWVFNKSQEAALAQGGFQNVDRRPADLRADAIAKDHCNFVNSGGIRHVRNLLPHTDPSI